MMFQPLGNQWLYKSTHCFNGGWNPRVNFAQVSECDVGLEGDFARFFSTKKKRNPDPEPFLVGCGSVGGFFLFS